MTQLTKAQLDLLSAAAANDGGASADGFASATARALIKRGYLISLPKIDGPSHLLATDQGRAGCCQSNGNSSPCGRNEPKPNPVYPMTDCQAASAAARLSL